MSTTAFLSTAYSHPPIQDSLHVNYSIPVHGILTSTHTGQSTCQLQHSCPRHTRIHPYRTVYMSTTAFLSTAYSHPPIQDSLHVNYSIPVHGILASTHTGQSTCQLQHSCPRHTHIHPYRTVYMSTTAFLSTAYSHPPIQDSLHVNYSIPVHGILTSTHTGQSTCQLQHSCPRHTHIHPYRTVYMSTTAFLSTAYSHPPIQDSLHVNYSIPVHGILTSTHTGQSTCQLQHSCPWHTHIHPYRTVYMSTTAFLSTAYSHPPIQDSLHVNYSIPVHGILTSTHTGQSTCQLQHSCPRHTHIHPYRTVYMSTTAFLSVSYRTVSVNYIIPVCVSLTVHSYRTVSVNYIIHVCISLTVHSYRTVSVNYIIHVCVSLTVHSYRTVSVNYIIHVCVSLTVHSYRTFSFNNIIPVCVILTVHSYRTVSVNYIIHVCVSLTVHSYRTVSVNYIIPVCVSLTVHSYRTVSVNYIIHVCVSLTVHSYRTVSVNYIIHVCVSLTVHSYRTVSVNYIIHVCVSLTVHSYRTVSVNYI